MSLHESSSMIHLGYILSSLQRKFDFKKKAFLEIGARTRAGNRMLILYINHYGVERKSLQKQDF